MQIKKLTVAIVVGLEQSKGYCKINLLKRALKKTCYLYCEYSVTFNYERLMCLVFVLILNSKTAGFFYSLSLCPADTVTG